jgi:UDP-N-acetylmuramoylalanine--D-glutamate ligase
LEGPGSSGLDGVRRAAVLGLGVSGVAAASALAELGIAVKAADASSSPALSERASVLEASGVEVRLGLGPDGPDGVSWLLDGVDVIVPSPGVPPSDAALKEAVARRLPVWSEIELGWRLLPSPEDCPVVAVTGTNGKTTTTTLVAELLRAAGVEAVAAGNIGTPLTETVRELRRSRGGTVLVCEVSSFQLAFVETFRPRVAIVLNVADDHYDWHAGPADYLAAKARITEFQQPSDLLVVRAGDPGCASIARASKARVAAFGLAPPAEVAGQIAVASRREAEVVAGVDSGAVRITSAVGAFAPLAIPCADIRLEGPHNLENVCAATTAALELGAAHGAVSRALAAFEGLPHRTTLVAEVNGVRYVDDSKATNPHATMRALAGLRDVVLIAGGRSKGMDLSELAAEEGRVSGVVVMGEAAGQLESVFGPKVLGRAADVEQAVAIAAAAARPGDTVLLSPACSSLDQYSSYAERGNRFVRAVEALAQVGGAR